MNTFLAFSINLHGNFKVPSPPLQFFHKLDDWIVATIAAIQYQHGMVFSAAHFRDLEFGVILQWLFIFLLLSYCDACSSRTPPRRPPSTPRPNITEHDALYNCPPQLAELFCLNGAQCVEIRFSHDRKVYSCSCADGFWGTRCEYKMLDGTYRAYLIETAGIAGGVAIAIFISFIVCMSLYVHMRRRRQRRLLENNNFSSEPRPFDKRPVKHDCPESIQLTTLA